ncbi:hypothetical protein ACRTAL_002357 [Clostridium perfringens]
MKKYKLIGVYVNNGSDIDFVFKEFARGMHMETGFGVRQINPNSFLTFYREVFTFITEKTKVADGKFDAVFIDDTIDKNIIETKIKPTLKNKDEINKYSIELTKKIFERMNRAGKE